MHVKTYVHLLSYFAVSVTLAGLKLRATLVCAARRWLPVDEPRDRRHLTCYALHGKGSLAAHDCERLDTVNSAHQCALVFPAGSKGDSSA